MTMIKISPKLDESWRNVLKDEFHKPYFTKLNEFLLSEKRQFEVYPPDNEIFRALEHTPLSRVKVVIIGQDPYHGPGQANGMCFSVNDDIKQPPSLRNIFKELQADVGIPPPTSGNLTPWADQGVLLLNAALTVRKSQAGLHQNKGWALFTDRVIEILNDGTEGLVFLLWGKFAQMKAAQINPNKHHLLKAAHPSPFSAHSGFFGCQHFSKTNALLNAMGKSEINWEL